MPAVGVNSSRLFVALVLGVLGALLVVGLLGVGLGSAQATTKKATSEKLTVRASPSKRR